MKIVTALATFCAIAVLLAFAAEPKVEKPPYNQFTDEEEIIIGDTLASRFEKKHAVAPSPILETYLNVLVASLAEKSQRPGLRFDVKVLREKKVNAFCLPGHIYVTTGLLDFVQSESELTGVLSHEVGHAVGRHTTNRIARISAVQSAVDAARNKGIFLNNQTAEQVADAGISIVYTLFERSFGRDVEREADLLGFYQMARARWHPSGMITMLEHVQRGSPKYGPAERILATHPEPRERVERLRAESSEVLLPANLRQDSFEFQVMKRTLGLLLM
jgi:predicted Zn-dependent protease